MLCAAMGGGSGRGSSTQRPPLLTRVEGMINKWQGEELPEEVMRGGGGARHGERRRRRREDSDGE